MHHYGTCTEMTYTPPWLREFLPPPPPPTTCTYSPSMGSHRVTVCHSKSPRLQTRFTNTESPRTPPTSLIAVLAEEGLGRRALLNYFRWGESSSFLFFGGGKDPDHLLPALVVGSPFQASTAVQRANNDWLFVLCVRGLLYTSCDRATTTTHKTKAINRGRRRLRDLKETTTKKKKKKHNRCDGGSRIRF